MVCVFFLSNHFRNKFSILMYSAFMLECTAKSTSFSNVLAYNIMRSGIQCEWTAFAHATPTPHAIYKIYVILNDTVTNITVRQPHQSTHLISISRPQLHWNGEPFWIIPIVYSSTIHNIWHHTPASFFLNGHNTTFFAMKNVKWNRFCWRKNSLSKIINIFKKMIWIELIYCKFACSARILRQNRWKKQRKYYLKPFFAILNSLKLSNFLRDNFCMYGKPIHWTYWILVKIHSLMAR